MSALPADAGVAVGILALQGDFEAHGQMVASAGGRPVEVRVPADLLGCDALVVP